MLLSSLLRHLTWPNLRHHAARHATAVLAVTLGVALAFAVHLINASTPWWRRGSRRPCGRSRATRPTGSPRSTPAPCSFNAAARHALGLQAAASGPHSTGPGPSIRIQSGLPLVELRVAGDCAVPGGPLALMDIAGAQAAFGRLGELTRILRLAPGAGRERMLRELALPATVRASTPAEAQQRLSNACRQRICARRLPRNASQGAPCKSQDYIARRSLS